MLIVNHFNLFLLNYIVLDFIKKRFYSIIDPAKFPKSQERACLLRKHAKTLLWDNFSLSCVPKLLLDILPWYRGNFPSKFRSYPQIRENYSLNVSSTKII
jgi:hypothetical protein